MNKESMIEFLNKVIFYLNMLKRIASDTDNRQLEDEVYVLCVKADMLRERLFSKVEEE